jgi:CAAX prenyl protease-like protein
LKHPALPYVAPFAIFVAFLGLAPYLAFLGWWEFPLRIGVMIAVLWFFSRDVIDLRVHHWAATIGIGVAVLLIWIAPDALIPGYRGHWLFQNSITVKLHTSIPQNLLSDPLVLVLRTIRAVIIVPIVEELFWRAWLMRWIINTDFEKVPLGTYTPQAMWITALLFASEHGPYWEVGLIAGLIYNWWMVRTKSLGDCILAHAVTNGLLCGYVVLTGKWEYWL